MKIGDNFTGTIVGKLKEILVIETKKEGKTVIVVYPKGTVVEVSSEEEYPHKITNKNMDEAVKYLKENEDS